MVNTENLKFIAINLLYIATFGLASLRKWQTGGVPDSFRDQFSESWLAVLPGDLALPYYTIAILETLITILFIFSMFFKEWQVTGKKTFMTSGLILSLFTFVILAYGLRLTGQFQGTANAFFYFGCTLIALYITENSAYEPKERIAPGSIKDGSE
ncbi:MAG: hypothetical protein EA359_02950 [Balneolaceae bacterium]|nr:MAG: hypothetical protein EA359_02950 [Balneolaceae bacterium]